MRDMMSVYVDHVWIEDQHKPHCSIQIKFNSEWTSLDQNLPIGKIGSIFIPIETFIPIIFVNVNVGSVSLIMVLYFLQAKFTLGC